MPFLKHFGFKENPFGLTPDPSMFYPDTQACALLDGLAFSLFRGDGLLKVVGEVGSGKTLLSRLLLARMAELKINTAYVNAPIALKAAEVPLKVAREFGLKITDQDDAATKLTDFLIKAHNQGRKCVLVIDEAQALGAEGLEAIRLLSNLETEKQKLLQIVLFGQNELDILLAQPSMRQIAQRINFAFQTHPLPADTVPDYVRYRIACAAIGLGHGNISLYGIMRDSTLSRLARASKGLPRVIHLLADKALIAAYAEGSKHVHPRHLRTAIKETPDLKIPWWWHHL